MTLELEFTTLLDESIDFGFGELSTCRVLEIDSALFISRAISLDVVDEIPSTALSKVSFEDHHLSSSFVSLSAVDVWSVTE